MNEITKFSILDEKNEIRNFGRNLDEKCQLIAKKVSNSFTFVGIIIILLQLG